MLQRALAAMVALIAVQTTFASSFDSGVLHMDWSGTARVDYFTSDNRLDDASNFLGTTLDGTLAVDADDWLAISVSARLTRSNVLHAANARVALLEGVVMLRFAKTRLSIGKQTVAWGRADILNPTDNLTPHDYIVLLPFERDQRMGTPSILLVQSLRDDLSLAVFDTPFFEPSRVPLPSDFGEYVAERPVRSLKHNEIGVRLDRAGSGVDASISYYSGYLLTPALVPLGVNASDVPLLSLRYPRIEVLGADFAATLGRFGLRGEIANLSPTESGPHDPLEDHPALYYVLGVDRSFAGAFSGNIQVFGRHIEGSRRPFSTSEQESVAAAYDDIILQQQDRNSYGLTARVSGSFFHETLTLELLTIYNLTRSNAFVRPLVSYVITDHVTLSTGAFLYTGASDSFFGALKKNQSAFVEWRYSL